MKVFLLFIILFVVVAILIIVVVLTALIVDIKTRKQESMILCEPELIKKIGRDFFEAGENYLGQWCGPVLGHDHPDFDEFYNSYMKKLNGKN